MSTCKDKVAPWIGVLAIGGFGAFVVFLLRHLGEQEPQWSRMVFIFGAVEAAGLAALGFFFGKEVNRARAVTAEERARGAEGAALDAMTQSAATRQKLADIAAFIEERAGTAKTAGEANGDWQELLRFARRLVKEG